MHQHTNPFLQHAVRRGQALLNEFNRVSALSGSMISACDEIIMSINSGNVQGAMNSAQNLRNMAGQVAQSTQQLNQTINERMEMAAFVLNKIQFRINELSNALQSIRSMSGEGYQMGPWQHHASMPYQQTNVPIM